MWGASKVWDIPGACGVNYRTPEAAYLVLWSRHGSRVERVLGKWTGRLRLADWVEGYREAIRPGGRLGYVSDQLGYTPEVVRAAVMRGDTEIEAWGGGLGDFPGQAP